MSRTILHFDWYCSCSLSYYYSSLTSPHIKSASIAFLLLNSLEIPQACWLFFSQNHSRSLQLIGSPSQLQLNIAYLLRSPTFCRFEAHHKFSSPTVTLRSRHSSDTILLLGYLTTTIALFARNFPALHIKSDSIALLRDSLEITLAYLVSLPDPIRYRILLRSPKLCWFEAHRNIGSSKLSFSLILHSTTFVTTTYPALRT